VGSWTMALDPRGILIVVGFYFVVGFYSMMNKDP
jgi:hypothetical protein